jgi:hypothetical protein
MSASVGALALAWSWSPWHGLTSCVRIMVDMYVSLYEAGHSFGANAPLFLFVLFDWCYGLMVLLNVSRFARFCRQSGV